MKNIHKLLIAFTVLALSTSSSFAQRPGPGGGGTRGDGGGQRPAGSQGGERQRPSQEQMQQRRADMAEKLGLSAEQKAGIKNIRQQERDALKALKDDSSLTKDQRKAKAQEIREASRAQSKAVLTPEQQAQAEALRKEHKDKKGDK